MNVTGHLVEAAGHDIDSDGLLDAGLHNGLQVAVRHQPAIDVGGAVDGDRREQAGDGRRGEQGALERTLPQHLAGAVDRARDDDRERMGGVLDARSRR
jgi:hypothetical protein